MQNSPQNPSVNLPVLPKLEVKPAPAKGTDTDIVAVYQDASHKAIPPKGPYGATVGKFRKVDGFAGRSGSVQAIPFSGRGGVKHALFVGLGAAGDLTEERAAYGGRSRVSKTLGRKERIGGRSSG